MAIEKLKSTMVNGLTESESLYPYYVPKNVGSANQPTDKVYNGWTVAQLYAAWDTLMAEHPNYVSKEIAPYKEDSGTYDLLRFTFAPEFGYDKTIFLCAGIHGNEEGGILSCLRIFQIICEEWKTNPQLSYLRNKVRFVVIPCGNPWGYANNSMVNSNTVGNTGLRGTNVNRNYDCGWQQVMSTGGEYSGSAPFSTNEAKWVRDTAYDIGLKNIHYAIDFHDAGDADLFGDYWINYNTHLKAQKTDVDKLVNYLVDKNITGTANIVHVCDTSTFGVFASYFNKTLGVPASTVEASYNVATFDEDFMTLQVETRLNAMIIAALGEYNTPEFSSDKAYFNLNYYESCTEKEFSYLSGYKSHANIISLWEALVTDHPTYALKSASPVLTADGKEAYTYIFSPKKYKKTVLVVGGKTLTGTYEYDRFSNCMYKVAKLLCEYGNEDEHLSDIKNNARIMFMPYIEYTDAVNAYINAYGNYNAAGVPNLGQNTTNNLNTIITGITGLSGVIYSTELTAFYSSVILNETTDAKFTLASQDTTDLLGVQDYADWLTVQGENVVVQATATSEFANYVFNNKSIPCVRIDTGIDHVNYEAHHSDYSGATEIEPITPMTHLVYAHETARRIRNMVNVIKLMCK